MIVYYRISDGGYAKEKPSYVTKQNCLQNFLQAFSRHGDVHFTLIQDNVSRENSIVYDDILQYYSRNMKSCRVVNTTYGHGAGSFQYALKDVLSNKNLWPEEIVYFVEDDYIHRLEAWEILMEGFVLGADFVTLYDHPDKYLDPSRGGNLFCEGNSEPTRVYQGGQCHWKLTNSTTMTFAAKVKTLRETQETLLKYTSGKHPQDFDMFLQLRNQEKTLISPLPAYATHGETKWLSHFVDWQSTLNFSLLLYKDSQ